MVDLVRDLTRVIRWNTAFVFSFLPFQTGNTQIERARLLGTTQVYNSRI